MHDIDALREKIVSELQADALPEEEQNQLIVDLTDALLERATLTLMSKLPPEVLNDVADNEELQADAAAMEALYRQHVPDMDAVVQAAFQEGIAVYKNSLAESE
jgi:hypothetical protein